jgi:uncharacterized protein (DUF885 family)
MMEKEEENNKLQFQKQKDIWPGRAKHFLIKQENENNGIKSQIYKRMGAKFEIKKFHDAILQVGCAVFETFKYMDEWANKQSK